MKRPIWAKSINMDSLVFYSRKTQVIDADYILKNIFPKHDKPNKKLAMHEEAVKQAALARQKREYLK